MNYLFYHILYRTYWWNITIIKEKDAAVLSAFLFLTALIGLNLLTVIFFVLEFIVKNSNLFPRWGHLPIMFIVLIYNYFNFIHKKKYKAIISDAENIDKADKRKRDIIVSLYIFLTFFLAILVASQRSITH